MNSKRNSLGMLILIGVSLGLNIWFLWRLANMKPVDKSETPEPEGPAIQRVSITATQAPVATVKAPFDWAVLESTSYPQYAKNLRDFGCPEPLVKTILERDVYSYYLDHRSKDLAPLLSSYWDLTTNDLDHVRSMVRANIQDAEETVDSLLEELVHAHREDPTITRIHRRTAKLNDVRLDFLSPEIREQVIQVERRPYTTNSAISRDQDIAQLLAPYELREYRLRSSPAVRSLLNTTYLDAPSATLKEIVARYCEAGVTGDDTDRSKLKEIVREVAGDQAAQVFELSYIRDFKTIYTVTAETQQDPSAAIAIYSIQQETKKLIGSNPDSAETIITEARRQVSKYVGPDQVGLLFDRLHFPNL